MTTASFETVLFEKRDGVLYLTLNRPAVLNAYNVQMRDDLYQAFEAARDDPDVLAVILKGAGERAFCAGADLKDFGKAPSRVIARQARWERDLWGLMLGLEKPLIAALHGYVLGSGLEMSLCCDIRIASEDAVFGLPEVSLGIIPAAGGTQTLPRAINRGKALELMLTGERVDAAEAFRLGMVNRVVPRRRLLREAEAAARKILGWDQRAVRLAKRAVTQGLDMPLEQGLALERTLAALLWKART